MLTVLRRAVADRLAPTSSAWRTPDDVDPAVLADALGVGAIQGVRVHDLDHGTTLRSQLQVTHGDGARTTLFAKNTPIRFGAGLLDGFARLCEREARFYRDVAPAVPTAPRAVLSRWDERTGRSTVVLGDLGEEGYRFQEAAQACTAEQADRVVRLLGDLHGSTIAGRSQGRLRTDDALFDLDSAGPRRMSRFVTRVLGRNPRSLAGLVPESIQVQSRVLRTHARIYPDVLAGYPRAFTHNDTHAGNIGFREDRAVLIDWQNCGWGPAVKDVAYFLATALEPEVRRDHEHDLLDAYRAQVAASGGPDWSAEEVWEAYRVLAVTGYVAAAVTAMFRDRLQAAANAEQSLRRACSAVADLDSFSALAERIAASAR